MWWIIGILAIIIIILFLVIRSKTSSSTRISLENIPSENPSELENNQVSKLINSLWVDDLKERIDASLECSKWDHPEVLEELMKIATGALRGEFRVAAAIGLCEHPSKRRINFLEEYLNRTIDGTAAFGGDRKATAVLILAVINGSMNLTQVIETGFDGSASVLHYLGQSEIPYKTIQDNTNQIGYLLAWCASIDSGYGQKELIKHLQGKVKLSRKLVDSILKYM